MSARMRASVLGSTTRTPVAAARAAILRPLAGEPAGLDPFGAAPPGRGRDARRDLLAIAKPTGSLPLRQRSRRTRRRRSHGAADLSAAPWQRSICDDYATEPQAEGHNHSPVVLSEPVVEGSRRRSRTAQTRRRTARDDEATEPQARAVTTAQSFYRNQSSRAAGDR